MNKLIMITYASHWMTCRAPILFICVHNPCYYWKYIHKWKVSARGKSSNAKHSDQINNQQYWNNTI